MSHHPRMIEIAKQLYVQPHSVAAIRAIDDGSCNVFLVGASVVDGGILIHRPCDEVVDEVNEALEESNYASTEEEATR